MVGDVLTPEGVQLRWQVVVGAIRASGPVMERLAAVGALGKHELGLRELLRDMADCGVLHESHDRIEIEVPRPVWDAVQKVRSGG